MFTAQLYTSTQLQGLLIIEGQPFMKLMIILFCLQEHDACIFTALSTVSHGVVSVTVLHSNAYSI